MKYFHNISTLPLINPPSPFPPEIKVTVPPYPLPKLLPYPPFNPPYPLYRSIYPAQSHIVYHIPIRIHHYYLGILHIPIGIHYHYHRIHNYYLRIHHIHQITHCINLYIFRDNKRIHFCYQKDRLNLYLFLPEARQF